MVCKYLIIKIEVSLALDKDRTGGRIEIIQGGNQTHAQGLLKPQK
jgi:hypothetical protein